MHLDDLFDFAGGLHLLSLLVAMDRVFHKHDLLFVFGPGVDDLPALVQFLHQLILAKGLQPEEAGRSPHCQVWRHALASVFVCPQLLVHITAFLGVTGRIERLKNSRSLFNVHLELDFLLKLFSSIISVPVLNRRPVILVLHIVLHDLVKHSFEGALVPRVLADLLRY